MALYTENRDNMYGLTTEYWKVARINIDAIYKFCDITLYGYATREARDQDKEPLEQKKVRANWSEGEFAKYFSAEALSKNRSSDPLSNIYEAAYNYVKEKENMFDDAKDC